MSDHTYVSKMVQSIPPSGIRKFFDIAATMDDVISLGIGEPDFATPEPIVQAGIEALRKGETHYTSNSGLLELRQAISGHLNKLYKVHYDPQEEILVTVGVSEALYLALAGIVDPGDEMLFADPCFVAYESIAKLAGAKPVAVPTSPETGFQITGAALEAAITDKTKVVLLASPNNPTGTVISPDNLEEIAAVVEEHDLVVISDEIYDQLVYDLPYTSFSSLAGMRARTVTLQGFSKAYAMTGWRVGYLAAPAALASEMRKIHQYLIMSAPTVAQWAALKALEVGAPFVEQMQQEYHRRRDLIVSGLNTIGLSCINPGGAFYAFPDVTSTGMDDDTFANTLLEEEHVAVVPGRAFGPSGTGFVRMSYATAYEKIELALEKIAAFVQRHKTL